jgi:hypothetical protein
MSELRPIGLVPVPSNTNVEPAAPASSGPGATSTEFRALLERLREQAAALERATEGSIRAENLSGAVQEASASLQGALSIAEGLLEAYRSSRIESQAAANAPATLPAD